MSCSPTRLGLFADSPTVWWSHFNQHLPKPARPTFSSILSTVQLAAVREVLEEIGAKEIPELLVVNKADTFTDTQRSRFANLYPEAVLISALEDSDFDDLLGAIGEALVVNTITLSLTVPYERGDVVAAAHRVGEVIEEKHDNLGTILDVRVPTKAMDLFRDFVRA